MSTSSLFLVFKTYFKSPDFLKFSDNLFFVVKACTLQFKKPAFFEDSVKVISEIDEMNKVKINFNQKIYRKSDLLVEAEVLVISVNKLGKITKIPNEIYLHLVTLKN